MRTYKTKGQIEDAISKDVTKFYVEILGVGPKQTKTYILKDMVIVRFEGKLLPIEENILAMMKDGNGIELVKNIRKALHQITTKRLCDIISQITKHQVISSHSDISTKTGERIEIFILDADFENEVVKQKPHKVP
ncbi:MAG: DUF2294 domain-containing protein [Patescibacteria group bacterium]